MVGPPPRRMQKPPSLLDKKKKKQPPKQVCCDDPKPEDDGEGHTVCMSCWTQLADTGNIVSEVNFSEDARGAATAQGGYVTNNARHANTLGAGAKRLGGSDRDPGQNAQANAKRILGGLCPRLNLSDTIKDQAVNVYMLASGSNFSAGRRTEEVVAASLYAVCRRHRQNQILLIDISELLRINVFRLGEVYKALCQNVYLNTDYGTANDRAVGEQQQLEVESLIMKYCRKLEFGNQTRQVAEDAARILRRMKRDWIVTGRHPAGLCGACIIYAARMNNFRRTKREVVYVAKVADQTVAKRMEEFKRTRTAAMSVQQFREKGLLVKHTHDPPSILEHERRKQKLEEKKRKRQSANGVEIDGQLDAASRESSAAAENPGPDGDDDGQRKRQRMANGAPATPAATQQEPRFDSEGFAIPNLPASMTQTQQSQQEPPKKRGRGRPRKETYVPTNEELMAEAELEREIQAMLDKDDEEDSLRVAQKKLDEEKAREHDEEAERRQREAMAGEKEKEKEKEAPSSNNRTVTFEDNQQPPPPQELVTAEDLELEFADDPEVLNCLLPEMERKVKEQIWVAENEDWMRVQVLKEINARLDKETKANKAGRKGGKGRRKKGAQQSGGEGGIGEANTPIETPLDANRAMFEKRGMPKGVSKHINYEALRNAYQTGNGSSSSNTSASQSRAPSEARSEADGSRAASTAPTEDGEQQQQQQRPQGPEMSPPQTQQADAGAQQDEEMNDADANADDGEGDPSDYVQPDGNGQGGIDDLDYGSDDDEGEGRGGWLRGADDDDDEGGGYDDDDEFGPLGRSSLPRYGDDEY